MYIYIYIYIYIYALAYYNSFSNSRNIYALDSLHTTSIFVCACNIEYLQHGVNFPMHAYIHDTLVPLCQWGHSIRNQLWFSRILHVLYIQHTYTTHACMQLVYLIVQHSIRDQVFDSVEAVLHCIHSTCSAVTSAECRNHAEVHDMRGKIFGCMYADVCVCACV